MPVTGRKINLITDILRLADKTLQSSFFISPKPDENLCFIGICNLYCNDLHPICGKGHMIEGSFTAYYPMFEGSDVIVSITSIPLKSTLKFYVTIPYGLCLCVCRPGNIHGRKVIRRKLPIEWTGRWIQISALNCNLKGVIRAAYWWKWSICRYLIFWLETPTDIIMDSSSN